jgi:hypothetical protein
MGDAKRRKLLGASPQHKIMSPQDVVNAVTASAEVGAWRLKPYRKTLEIEFKSWQELPKEAQVEFADFEAESNRLIWVLDDFGGGMVALVGMDEIESTIARIFELREQSHE